MEHNGASRQSEMETTFVLDLDNTNKKVNNNVALVLKKRIIAQVQKHPLLYNFDHDGFNNIAANDEAWSAIAQSLKMDVKTCKNTWVDLRYKYQKHARRLRKYLGSGYKNIKRRPIMIFENDMMFLWRFVAKKRRCPLPYKTELNVINMENNHTTAVEEDDVVLLENDPIVIDLDKEDESSQKASGTQFIISKQMTTLVELVKVYRELYVPSNRYYNDYNRKGIIWNAFANELGDKATRLMKCWIQLQTRYEWELNHQYKSGDVTDPLGTMQPTNLQGLLSFLRDYVTQNSNTVYKQSHYLKEGWYQPIEHFKNIFGLLATMKKNPRIVNITEQQLNIPQKSKQYHNLWKNISKNKGVTPGQCETTWLMLRHFYWELVNMRKQNYQLQDKWYFESNITELYLIASANPSESTSNIALNDVTSTATSVSTSISTSTSTSTSTLTLATATGTARTLSSSLVPKTIALLPTIATATTTTAVITPMSRTLAEILPSKSTTFHQSTVQAIPTNIQLDENSIDASKILKKRVVPSILPKPTASVCGKLIYPEPPSQTSSSTIVNAVCGTTITSSALTRPINEVTGIVNTQGPQNKKARLDNNNYNGGLLNYNDLNNCGQIKVSNNFTANTPIQNIYSNADITPVISHTKNNDTSVAFNNENKSDNDNADSDVEIIEDNIPRLVVSNMAALHPSANLNKVPQLLPRPMPQPQSLLKPQLQRQPLLQPQPLPQMQLPSQLLSQRPKNLSIKLAHSQPQLQPQSQKQLHLQLQSRPQQLQIQTLQQPQQQPQLQVQPQQLQLQLRHQAYPRLQMQPPPMVQIQPNVASPSRYPMALPLPQPVQTVILPSPVFQQQLQSACPPAQSLTPLQQRLITPPITSALPRPQLQPQPLPQRLMKLPVRARMQTHTNLLPQGINVRLLSVPSSASTGPPRANSPRNPLPNQLNDLLNKISASTTPPIHPASSSPPSSSPPHPSPSSTPSAPSIVKPSVGADLSPAATLKISNAATVLNSNEIMLELISTSKNSELVVVGPSVSGKFSMSMSKTARFIREIMSIPQLHNKQNYAIRNTFWAHVSKKFNMPVHICKACWNFLQENYENFSEIGPLEDLMKPFHSDIPVWQSSNDLFNVFNEYAVKSGWMTYKADLPQLMKYIGNYPCLYEYLQSHSKVLLSMNERDDIQMAWRNINSKLWWIKEKTTIWTAFKNVFWVYMSDLERGVDNRWSTNWWRVLVEMRFLVTMRYHDKQAMYFIVNNKINAEIAHNEALEAISAKENENQNVNADTSLNNSENPNVNERQREDVNKNASENAKENEKEEEHLQNSAGKTATSVDSGVVVIREDNDPDFMIPADSEIMVSGSQQWFFGADSDTQFISMNSIIQAVKRHSAVYQQNTQNKEEEWVLIADELKTTTERCKTAFYNALKIYHMYLGRDPNGSCQISEKYFKDLAEICRKAKNEIKLSIKTPSELNKAIGNDCSSDRKVIVTDYKPDINMDTCKPALVVKNWAFAVGILPVETQQQVGAQVRGIFHKYGPVAEE